MKKKAIDKFMEEIAPAMVQCRACGEKVTEQAARAGEHDCPNLIARCMACGAEVPLKDAKEGKHTCQDNDVQEIPGYVMGLIKFLAFMEAMKKAREEADEEGK